MRTHIWGGFRVQGQYSEGATLSGPVMPYGIIDPKQAVIS